MARRTQLIWVRDPAGFSNTGTGALAQGQTFVDSVRDRVNVLQVGGLLIPGLEEFTVVRTILDVFVQARVADAQTAYPYGLVGARVGSSAERVQLFASAPARAAAGLAQDPMANWCCHGVCMVGEAIDFAGVGDNSTSHYHFDQRAMRRVDQSEDYLIFSTLQNLVLATDILHVQVAWSVLLQSK